MSHTHPLRAGVAVVLIMSGADLRRSVADAKNVAADFRYKVALGDPDQGGRLYLIDANTVVDEATENITLDRIQDAGADVPHVVAKFDRLTTGDDRISAEAPETIGLSLAGMVTTVNAHTPAPAGIEGDLATLLASPTKVIPSVVAAAFVRLVISLMDDQALDYVTLGQNDVAIRKVDAGTIEITRPILTQHKRGWVVAIGEGFHCSRAGYGHGETDDLERAVAFEVFNDAVNAALLLGGRVVPILVSEDPQAVRKLVPPRGQPEEPATSGFVEVTQPAPARSTGASPKPRIEEAADLIERMGYVPFVSAICTIIREARREDLGSLRFNVVDPINAALINRGAEA